MIRSSQRPLLDNTHNTHTLQNSMPPAGFETAISTGERPQIHVLIRVGNGTKFCKNISLPISVAVPSTALRGPGRQANLHHVTTCASILCCLTLQCVISKNKPCVAQIEELPDITVRAQQQRSSGTAMPTHCCRQNEEGFRHRGL